MKCPVCVTESLVMSERSGVEIDYCPKCRGVWLDRGELDKIIERAEQQLSGRSTHKEEKPYHDDRRSPYDDRKHYDDRKSYGHHKPHKKESILGELFDW